MLLQHPGVADIAVIGVDGKAEATELPKAFVVKRKEMELSEEDVRRWLKERLAAYKQLEGGVTFVGEIPKNASGKILKRMLRDGLKKWKGVAKL